MEGVFFRHNFPCGRARDRDRDAVRLPHSNAPSHFGRRVLRLMAACLAGLLLGGCAVPQHKREHLADPIMRLDEDPESRKMEEHFLPYREGSMGGSGGTGGGCGC